MAEAANSSTSKYVLLCEGVRDKAFFRHLISERKLPDFRITYPNEKSDPSKPSEGGGRSGFHSALVGFRAASEWTGAEAILIASDSDDDPPGSFREVQNQIDKAKYLVPAKPLQVARGSGSVPVVVLMLPWENEIGSLDTLCLPTMYNAWPAGGKCLDEFCECAEVATWRSQTKQGKLRVQVLLSAMCPSDPNTTLRYAWSGDGRGNPVPLSHSSFDRVVDFLRKFPEIVGA